MKRRTFLGTLAGLAAGLGLVRRASAQPAMARPWQIVRTSEHAGPVTTAFDDNDPLAGNEFIPAGTTRSRVVVSFNGRLQPDGKGSFVIPQEVIAYQQDGGAAPDPNPCRQPNRTTFVPSPDGWMLTITAYDRNPEPIDPWSFSYGWIQFYNAQVSIRVDGGTHAHVRIQGMADLNGWSLDTMRRQLTTPGHQLIYRIADSRLIDSDQTTPEPLGIALVENGESALITAGWVVELANSLTAAIDRFEATMRPLERLMEGE